MSHAFALVLRYPGEDINEIMHRLSYRHKDGFWRSWSIGCGRCAGSLNLKEGSRTEPQSFFHNFVWKENEIEELKKKHPRASDCGYKGDINNLEELNFEFIITKDQFIEPVGPFYPYIKDLPDDVELICVDMSY